MVFGVKSAPAVGAKGTIINTIVNSWLDLDGKYHILSWVSTLEIITIFIMKQSYLI